MTNDAQEYISKLINKENITYLDLSNRNLVGDMNLVDFSKLKSVNAYGNKFAKLDFLFSLPNKNKLEKINFFGNEVKQVDFARLFAEFPNLQSINLENNPLGVNFTSLNDIQFLQLVNSVEEKKVKINSWKGTLLLDLLKHTKQLREIVSSNHTNSCLQPLTKIKHFKLQTQEIKPIDLNKQLNRTQPVNLISSLVFFGNLILLVTGYLLVGKSKSKSQQN